MLKTKRRLKRGHESRRAIAMGLLCAGLPWITKAEINLPANLTWGTYKFEDAFPGLLFDRPVDIVTAPGEGHRLFVVEQTGRIWSVTRFEAPEKTLFLDLTGVIQAPQEPRTGADAEYGLLGLAFHPRFQENGFFYVYYTIIGTTEFGTGWHDQLARFEATGEARETVQLESRLPILTQFDPDSYHNGGAIQFGPDGYLYLALGDEGSAFDRYLNSQKIDRDFFSGILRLDVDGKEASLNPNPHPAIAGHHWIPQDNPFLNRADFNGRFLDPLQIRTEFFAVGLRNPWRMSFDPATGLLYSNDVGQNLEEEINLVLPGANHGWVYYEGNIQHQTPPEDLSFYVPPVFAYPRAQGNVIGASLCYRGDAYTELYGAYLFSDVASGRIGALKLLDSELAVGAKRIQTEMFDLQRTLTQRDLRAATIAWSEGVSPLWEPIPPSGLSAENGAILDHDSDGIIVVSGTNSFHETYTVELPIQEFSELSALRLDVLPIDPDKPWKGPSRSASMAVILSEMRADFLPAGEGSPGLPVPLSFVEASNKPHGPYHGELLVDGNPGTAWAIRPEDAYTANHLVFGITPSAEISGAGTLVIVLEQAFGYAPNMGRFQLSVSRNALSATHSFPKRIEDILRKTGDSRTSDDWDMLEGFYKATLSDESARIRELQAEAALLVASFQGSVDWIANDDRIVTFGVHPGTGGILGADLGDGMIKRLVAVEGSRGSVPETLSATGAFESLNPLVVAPGIMPYEINTPFWSDHADKKRWVSIPPGAKLGFHRDGPWDFPAGTIWIKHFELDLVPGDHGSSRKLETRFLVKTSDGAYGLTYRWNDAQTEAYLVDAGGEEEALVLADPGGSRTQMWSYPARHQCQQCHTPAGGFALGFNTHQLNRNGPQPFGTSNQIERWIAEGWIANPPASTTNLPASVAVGDHTTSVIRRVRSYLASNCAQCHQPGGTGGGSMDARFHVALPEMNLLNMIPADDLGDSDARIVKPGAPEQSVLFRRIAELEAHHMPPLATSVLNSDAIELLRYWIQIEATLLLTGDNIPPTLTLSASPTGTAAVGQEIFLEARAADSDGTVTRLEFYVDDAILATTIAHPWTASWSPPAPNVYDIHAVAFDDAGSWTVSSTLGITVHPASPLISGIVIESDNKIRLTAPGRSLEEVTIEASSDLLIWEVLPVSTVLGDSVSFVDPGSAGTRVRFYRLVWR